MSGTDGLGLCSYNELSDYLMEISEDRLLNYVRENHGRYELVDDAYQRVKLPSVRYQIACVFTLLGEYTIAETIHHPKWDDLSSWGDKVGNNLLKDFMKAYP